MHEDITTPNSTREFLADQRLRSVHEWKWRSPLLVGFLAFLHPLGLMLTSFCAAVFFMAVWLTLIHVWPSRPIGVSLLLAMICGGYGYFNTRWKNSFIEKYRYGLPGTGNQNPKKCAAGGAGN